MKRNQIALSIILLLFMPNIIFAGEITNKDNHLRDHPHDARCDISVSNPNIDYGVMTPWKLDNIGNGNLSLGTRIITLNITCPYARGMKLLIHGNSVNHNRFRYGNQGILYIRILDAQLDGYPVELLALTQKASSLQDTAPITNVDVGQLLTPTTQGKLVDGKVFTIRAEVQPVLEVGNYHITSPQRNETIITFSLVN
ncbi:hypothetical protein ACTVOR_14800 [Serratia nevei]|uniref:hypothetical protein n=1 Tax=Serratia nevei TaxID=2703794 RepID=UPI003FA71987